MSDEQAYEWINPVFKNKADPTRCAQELDDIEQKYGDTEPENVVDYAQSKRTELHKLFEWDDKEAARLQREATARNVVQSLRVVVTTTHEPQRKLVRRYVNVPKVGYRKLSVVKNSPRMAIAVHLKAVQDLENWLERYSEVVGQLPTLHSDIDEMVKKLRDAIRDREERMAAE